MTDNLHIDSEPTDWLKRQQPGAVDWVPAAAAAVEHVLLHGADGDWNRLVLTDPDLPRLGEPDWATRELVSLAASKLYEQHGETEHAGYPEEDVPGWANVIEPVVDRYVNEEVHSSLQMVAEQPDDYPMPDFGSGETPTTVDVVQVSPHQRGDAHVSGYVRRNG